MEFLKILVLRGPNFWSRRTVIEVWVDLQDLKDTASNTVPGLYERLTSWLPGLIEHRCGVGERGGFLQRLRDGTYPAHMLEHVTIELENLSGTPVGFGKARETSQPGVYKVAFRYRNEQVGRACLMEARELLLAAIHDRPYDAPAAIARLREYADRVWLGPSTRSIVDAADARSIPSQRLSDGNLVQLGYGVKQHRIWTAETDRTSAIAESIASDKQLTRSLLQACGVPVPRGRLADCATDAWDAANECGLPVVVKPRDGNHGRGVFTELADQGDIERAYEAALKEGSGVIVEQFIRGNEHRLLVVGDRLVAAAAGHPVWVVGDGKSNLRELIALQIDSDPRRGIGEDFPLNRIELDAVALLDLDRQGVTPESVPEEGRRVLVQRNGNVAFDVTDSVHPEVAATAVLAVRVVGLDVAGLDLVAQDISRPLDEQGGAIVEVNAGPGLLMHLKPAEGTPRPVGEAIVESLFPGDADGRIPICCVTGTNGKTVVTRLVARMLMDAGRRVGWTCTDGWFLDRRRVERGNCADGRNARKVLLNPGVEAAVFEADAQGILNDGLGFDRCQVAVVTNLGAADHLGLNYIDTPEQMFQVKRCPVDVVLPTGTAVLNAADPAVAEMASLSAGAVTFFSIDPDLPVVAGHRAAGKRAVFVRHAHVVVADGDTETVLLPLADITLTRGGTARFQVENVLAAVGAGLAMGLPPDAIAAGLRGFGTDPLDLPGRLDVMPVAGRTVIVDDAHNTAALDALVAALEPFARVLRSIVWSVGGGRSDDDVTVQGERLGAAFDRVFLCDEAAVGSDDATRFRRLLHTAAAGGGRAVEVLVYPDRGVAIETALDRTGPGEVVVIQTDEKRVSPTVDLVRDRVALGGGAGWK